MKHSKPLNLMKPTQIKNTNRLMCNHTTRNLARWVLLAAAALVAPALPAAETTVARQDWQFSSGATVVGPDAVSNVTTPAQATIVPGEFASGWLPQVPPLGNANGVWDLGQRGTVTIACPPASGPGAAKTIRVRIAQWIDGSIFNDFADVSIPGATRGTVTARPLGTAVLGGWVEDFSEWSAPEGSDAGQIVVTSQSNGSIVDRIVVETEAASAPAVPLGIRQLGGGLAEVSWPASATGFALEQTGSLNGLIAWEPTPGTPQITGGQFTITVETGVSARFFRLRKQ